MSDLFEKGQEYENQCDYVNAFRAYLQVAEAGDSFAQNKLASMYYNGDGVEQNYDEAFKWATKAIHNNSADSFFNLAFLYYMGHGVEQNYTEAAKLFEIAADKGNAGACFILSAMYEQGQGVERSHQISWMWYMKSVENGNSISQNNLATKYELGIDVEQDYNEAMRWYLMASNQNDEWAHIAQCNLAKMYESGIGIEQNYAEALKWYEKSAERGNVDAQCALACMYYDGSGVEQNFECAKYWFERASNNGSSYGCYRLGNLYRDGLGVSSSFSKAIDLWEQSCGITELFCPSSAYQLGYAYYDGLGVERDLKKSKYYFELAIENGYQCSYALEIVKRELGEAVQDNLMHEYAEKTAQKPVPNDRLYVRISKDLEKDFGSAWHVIDKETKNFLTSGLFTFMVYYSTGAHIYGNLDFSQSIMEMCKALERELGKYLYTGYIEYLKSERINPKIFNPKRSFIKKVSATEYDYYSSGDVKKFTLGNLEDTLGIERFMQPTVADDMGIVKSNKYELKIDETMSSYLDCLFKLDAFSSENRNREIQHYIISLYQEVQSIADSFRNPSAHTNIMKYHRAEVCGNYIIKVKKLLRNFIDKIKEMHQ